MSFFRLCVSTMLLLFSDVAMSENWVQIGPGKSDGYATEFEIDIDGTQRNGQRRIYYIRPKGAAKGIERVADCAERTMSYKREPYNAVDIRKTNVFYEAAFERVCSDFVRAE